MFPAFLKFALSLDAFTWLPRRDQISQKWCKTFKTLWNWSKCAWCPGRKEPLVRGKFETYWPYPWDISRESSRTLETSYNIWGRGHPGQETFLRPSHGSQLFSFLGIIVNWSWLDYETPKSCWPGHRVLDGNTLSCSQIILISGTNPVLEKQLGLKSPSRNFYLPVCFEGQLFHRCS